MGMKITFTIFFLFLLISSSIISAEDSQHWTQKIFSTSENRLIKLSIDDHCFDSSAKNFNTMKFKQKFNSVKECQSYIEKYKSLKN